MSREIWKFELEITDEQIINIPIGAQIISVQAQRGEPCLWAIVNAEERCASPKKIIIHGTGHAISEDAGNYIGTFQQMNGDLIWHVFEGKD